MPPRTDRVRVDVLGPIRVLDVNGRDITPDGPLQRRLLALLVLRRGHVVSTDAAIEALWPTGPPRDPVAAVQNHVFRLRRSLPDGLVESIGDGYRLTTSMLDVDADRLADAVGTGAPAPATLAALDDTLARWSGPAYPELDDVDEGRAEATRLGELRLRALEARAELRMAAGEIDDVIVELAALVDAEPLRERPRSLLMAALARGGRRVEALRVYDDFRRLLADELGIEPSPVLAAEHADLLDGTAGAGWSPAARVPVPVTSLVGRDQLVDDVSARVEAERLVTLVGPGGVGKTRVAVEVAHRLRAERTDRSVVMVELAMADQASAVDAVAAALGIDARPDVPLVDRIAGVLDDSELVIVMDNCEHVLDPIAALVERLVARCPHVAVLTTSRERLRIAGEHVCRVPTLPFDGGEGPAVRLFLERASAVSPAFAPDPATVAHVAEIVRRLDGLPLAIELAAARLLTHDVAEVAAGLDQRFALLSAGYRTSTRHGSLSAAVSWSYGLLDRRLQRIFADVSVFAGPFTVADAAAVCADEPATVGAALGGLAERSLAMRSPGHRYVLLETLRDFGAEQLAADGRTDAVHERHARRQVERAERADGRMLEHDSGAIGEIDDAIPELRAAFGWLLDHDEVELAGRLVAALLDYGLLGQRPDVLAWAERVIDADPDDRSPVAPLVWAASAYATWMGGDIAGAAARSRRALEVSDRAGVLRAEVATVCGNSALFEGHLDDAVRWYRQAAAATADDRQQRLVVESTEVLARAYAGDPTAIDVADRLVAAVGDTITPHSAYVWYCAGEAYQPVDVARATATFDRAIELAERTNAAFAGSLAGASRASIEARFGDPIAAAADYRRLLAQWRRAGMWATQWTMLRSVAGLLDRLGRHRDAAVLEGAVRATTAGHRIFGADEQALGELGARLRSVLGEEAYAEARSQGGRLDGDAAVEHALRALVAVPVTTSVARRGSPGPTSRPARG